MALRLTVATKGGAIIIRAAGRLTAPELGEMEQLTHSIEGPLSIDLFDLSWADDAGVEALRTLAREGVQLLNPSPYLALLLEEEGSGPSRSLR